MEIVKWANKNMHVSQETVNEFEGTLQLLPTVVAIHHKRTLYSRIISKILSYIYIHKKLHLSGLFPRIYFRKNRFCILMGTEYEKCMRYFFFSKANSAYFFDAWPSTHKNIESFIKEFQVTTVFFSSEQVTNIFQNKRLGIRCEWLPEAINLKIYQYKSYNEKDIDVLQFGRKYDLYHDKIRDILIDNNYSYLYEQVKGQIVFPNQDEFIEGLARTKISVCFPSSLTHPERSGEITTMTVRYLQSMASKCLIVGVLPQEMKKLFGYIPIIEVDFNNPDGQLLSILENYSTYIPLIEKNYKTVKNLHTWEQRCQSIMNILADEHS